jgi:hypothetical protein
MRELIAYLAILPSILSPMAVAESMQHPITVSNTDLSYPPLDHVPSYHHMPDFQLQETGLSSLASPEFWYEGITHNGEASFMPSSYKSNYSVYRNVVSDFGADNTGTVDASAAIQDAINGTYTDILRQNGV